MISINFKSMSYLYANADANVSSVTFNESELDSVYEQVKDMYERKHRPDMPSEPGWYVTQDGEDLLSYDGDAWHIHNVTCETQLFADGDLDTTDWNVVKRTFDTDSFPLIPVKLKDTALAERRLRNLVNHLNEIIRLRTILLKEPNESELVSAINREGLTVVQDILTRLESGRYDHD